MDKEDTMKSNANSENIIVDNVIKSELTNTDQENSEIQNKKPSQIVETDKENNSKEVLLPGILNPENEEICFKVIYNKNKYDVSFPLSKTVMELKTHLQSIIGVPQAMQKVMIKGLAKDERTLKELGVTKGGKIMVVGSKLDDVIAVSTPSHVELSDDKAAESTKEPFCKQKMHRKVLDKGIPEDVMPGIKNIKEALPQYPLAGMLNKQGGKVRLTFKLELDQIWIGTKERTDKVPMNSIKNVVSEAIEGHEEYHLMALQLGPTEASRYWVYWVPAQYVDAIKDAVLGTWPL